MRDMSTTRRLALARNVKVGARDVHVRLSSGGSIVIPFERFRFLREASPAERADCMVDDEGMTIWWPSLREGVSVAGLPGVSEEELEALVDKRG